MLGTLISPYCSGLGNLIFVYLALQRNLPGEVVTNCVTNNWTNLTLVLSIPAIFWGIKADNSDTSIIAFFFTLLLVILSHTGVLTVYDGITLVFAFILWQVYNLKVTTVAHIRWTLLLYIGTLMLGGWITYFSLDRLVSLLTEHIWQITGYLMVLPNFIFAIYYGYKRNSNVVYSSQVGDGHICIPLCIGITAIFSPTPIQVNLMPLLLICAAHVFAQGKISRMYGFILLILFVLLPGGT